MSEIDDIKQLINDGTRRLQKLKEQKAKYGIGAPPEVLIEIEDLERENQANQLKYEHMLAELRQAGRQLTEVETDNFMRFLQAMGYEILDKKQISATNIFFLCRIRVGIEIQSNIISVVIGQLLLSDYEKLRSAISISKYSGFLICETAIPAQIKDIARQENMRVYSYQELINQIIDFTPYLNRLDAEYKDSNVLKYYTDIHCISSDGAHIPINQYVGEWLEHPKNRHLSILGGFGSGKTWFCHKLLADQITRCLHNPMERIPILITLREYSKAYDIVQVITDLFANRLKISLPAGYETFDFLNRAGRFLLIFDGLDEMERRVSDYQAVADNFWELARVAKYERSKVILTCRDTYFRNEVEEKEVLARGGKKINIIENEEIYELGIEIPYSTVTLRELSSNEIREILEKRLGENADAIWHTIQSSPDLFDLARRPSLIDMLIQVIPEMTIQKGKSRLSLANLFERYFNQSLKSYQSADATIELSKRLIFLEELAWEMYITQQSVSWSAFPDLVRKHLDRNPSTEQILFYEKSLRSQSYLSRDKMGNYAFAHKSFMEFLVARKIFKLLSSVDISQQTLIPQLDPTFAQMFGQVSFTLETRNFIKELLQEDHTVEKAVRTKLNYLIEATKSSQSETTRNLGGNAISVLHMLGESFRGKDLSNTILKNADLRSADLTGTKFKKANLFGAILSNAVLSDVDMSYADLSEARFEQVKTISSIDWSPDEQRLVISCDDTNLKVFNIKDQLEGKESTSRPAILFGHENPVLSVSWSPSGDFIASIDSERNIVVWNGSDFSIIRRWQSHDLLTSHPIYQPGHISRQVFFSKSKDEILVGNSQLLIILDMMYEKPIAVLLAKEGFGEAKVNDMTVCRDNWLGQEDWKIKYSNGISLSRLQHKSIAFERRALIASRGRSELSTSASQTALFPEQNMDRLVISKPSTALKTEKVEPVPQTQELTYLSPQFKNSEEYELIPVNNMTTAVYSPSGKLFAYGTKSKVTVMDRGFIRCELDLSLSCDGLNIHGATGLSESVLLTLDSKGIELDENQRSLWRKAIEREKDRVKSMNTGILNSSTQVFY